MSKYDPVWAYVRNDGRDTFSLSFEKIEEIAGVLVDHSFLQYKKELEGYGYRVKKISQKEKTVYFCRFDPQEKAEAEKKNTIRWKCPKCGREFSRRDQQHYCIKPATIEEYIALQDEAMRPKLLELRTIIHNAIPDAEECISWSMPTYRKGKNIINFASSKNHLGLYPGDEAAAVFAEELKEYSVSKGTIRLPWDRDLPEDLIERIAVWCRRKYGQED